MTQLLRFSPHTPMGVKGLTTFLKEHRHKLSCTLELETTDSADTTATAHASPTAETHHDARGRGIDVVVDGWS